MLELRDNSVVSLFIDGLIRSHLIDVIVARQEGKAAGNIPIFIDPIGHSDPFVFTDGYSYRWIVISIMVFLLSSSARAGRER